MIAARYRALLILGFLLFPVAAFAYFPIKEAIILYQNLPAVKERRLRAFFDLNQDGWLNYYEQGLLISYKKFHWPLADNDKKKMYDFNGDLMLEPVEEKMWREKKPLPKPLTDKFKKDTRKRL